MLNDKYSRREFLKGVALATAAAPLIIHAGETPSPRASRISYYCNGKIYVNELGGPEGKPLISPPIKGQEDFKPSWSKTGDMLVCFRRLEGDPANVMTWKSAIFIINVDGSGMHRLSDGTHTDFNPTWTRDGKNTPIWNRKNDKGGGFIVMQSKVGGTPGEEVAITDPHFHNWGHSCLTDGRIFVGSWSPKKGYGVYLLTRKEGGKPLYEQMQCELVPQGEFHRASISPNEKKICFEYFKGHKFKEPGHTLYIADFDAQQRTITNPKAIANPDGKPIWFAYPRWINGESAVIYHSTQTGKGQLYVYQLEDGSTKRVSANPKADYRYPHGEAAPC